MIKALKLKRGGINLPLIQEKPDFYTNAFLPSIALVPVSCGNNKTGSVFVSAGEFVKEGQLIAKCDSNNISFHSPVPGRVLDVFDSPLSEGCFGKVIKIQLEGSFSLLGKPSGKLHWKTLDSKNLKLMFSSYGVVNTSGKMTSLAGDINTGKPGCLLVRLFEKDPTYVMDSFLVRNFISEMAEGIGIILKASGIKNVYFLFGEITDNSLMEDFIARVNSFIDSDVSVDYGTVKEKYPVANNKLLFERLKNQKKIAGDTCGLAVDASTVVSAYNSVIFDKPVLERFVHVSGSGVVNQKMLKVRIGTKIGDLIDECGGFSGTPGRIIVNGLLSGVSIYDLDTPVSKDTESIIVIEKNEYREFFSTDCIHCGACISVCPVGINPVKIYSYIRNNLLTEAFNEEGENCIFCSCCSCVCPSRIPLVKIFQIAKKEVCND